MDMVIQMEQVSKIYPDGGGKEIAALNDISLRIKKGTFTAIMGRSGSGKTTLLNIIGALDTATKGKILLEEQDLTKLNDVQLSKIRRSKIGIVFQKYRLLEEYTVWDNVCLPIYLDKKQVDEEYIKKLLQTFGILERRRAYPSQLSGGQQQRVAIARAMANKPAILLADEPTGNLDYKTGTEVLEVLGKSQQEYSQTIIMVTHDSECAERANRIIKIEDGQICADNEQHRLDK